MSIVSELKDKIYGGGMVERAEACQLCDAPLQELMTAADEIREYFCQNTFDLCTIVNGKCGKCSEDCKFCAQSAYNDTVIDHVHGLLDTETLVADARKNYLQGILRYSIVTSGRALTKREVDQVCESIRRIRSEVGIQVCVSFGLLDKEDFMKLKEAGASRVHCNLESSRRYFAEICSTHTYDEKIQTIRAAKEAGLTVCSGGIIGLGETMEDRIDLALTVRSLGVRSVPVNMLNPIPGTPFGKNKIMTNDELCRVVSIFRFLIPDGNIRLAGGRGLIGDKGVQCFKSGANAAITGDLLTTSGITVEMDHKLLKELGFIVKSSS